jgi:hypothetical protein
MKVILQRAGKRNGKTSYVARGRFRVYWDLRQGARDVWVATDGQRFLRCDNLSEAREAIAEMDGDKPS